MKKFVYIILKGLLSIFAALPLKAHYRLSSILCFLLEKVFRYRVYDTTVNLARCFPQKTYGEIKHLTHLFYRHFTDVIVEAVWFGGSNGPDRLRKQHIVEFSNPEELRRLYDKCPSVAIMCSHCGNWELFGGVDNYNYTPIDDYIDEKNVCVVYRRLSDGIWDRLFRENRLAALKDPDGFPGYVESADLVRYAYRNKEEKKFYFAITDQKPYFIGCSKLLMDFFYDTVETMTGMAALAHKFSMGVTFLKMPVVSRGKYSMEFITICDDASRMGVEEIMKEYYRLLEEEIREQPENYLWTHHRWWK